MKSQKHRFWAFFCLFLGLIIFQQVFSLEQNSRLSRALSNSAHVPWFFILTILLWLLLEKTNALSIYQKASAFLIAILLLSTALEGLQLLNQRDASWSDVTLNLTGATAATLALLASRFWRQSMKSKSMAAGTLAIAVFFSGLTPVLGELRLRLEQKALAPVLVDFHPHSAVLRTTLRGAWEMEPLPGARYEDTRFEPEARIKLDQGIRWPGIVLREPLRDWRPFTNLIIKARLASNEPLEFNLRVETFEDKGLDSIYTLQLNPGENEHIIPIAQLSSKGSSPSAVKALYFYAVSEIRTKDSFYLTSIVLGK